jgi:hypothetical protein
MLWNATGVWRTIERRSAAAPRSHRHTDVMPIGDHRHMKRLPLDLAVLVVLTAAMIAVSVWLMRPL